MFQREKRSVQNKSSSRGPLTGGRHIHKCEGQTGRLIWKYTGVRVRSEAQVWFSCPSDRRKINTETREAAKKTTKTKENRKIDK